MNSWPITGEWAVPRQCYRQSQTASWDWEKDFFGKTWIAKTGSFLTKKSLFIDEVDQQNQFIKPRNCLMEILPVSTTLIASASFLWTYQPGLSGCISETSNMLWATNALISDCTQPAPFQRETQHNNLLPPAALAPVCCSVATISKPHNAAARTTDRRSYCELKTTAASKRLAWLLGFFLIWTGLCTSNSKNLKKHNSSDSIFVDKFPLW